MWWRVLYLLLFLAVTGIGFQSFFDDAYAKAPLVSMGQRGIIIADSALILRRWGDWKPIAELSPGDLDPSMRDARIHGSEGVEREYIGKIVTAHSGWVSDGTSVLLYNDVRGSWWPLWLATFPSVPLAGIWTYKWIRAHRALRAGRCPACGYDLRATPDRCPECGHAAGPNAILPSGDA